jgi:hypothetical protein
MGLGAYAVDRDAGGNPFLNVGGEALGLGVAGGVEVVVVDVELRVGVGGACSVKCKSDEIRAPSRTVRYLFPSRRGNVTYRTL